MFMAYRNTDKLSIGILTGVLNKHCKLKDIKEFDVETENSRKNLFHMGYTGLVEYEKNKFLLTYYIKKKAEYPYIRLSRLEWKN